MKEFFKGELETLQAKTGIRQLENLMQKTDWRKEVETLIELMIKETDLPPFNLVKPETKQRVIADAILNDQDFIGLNPKFVRKALNAWWNNNGARVIEEMNAYEVKPVELTPEQDEYVNVMLESYKRRLLSGGGPKPIPKLEPEEIKVEGAEWTSPIEKSVSKGHGYTPAEVIKKHQDHVRYVRANYDVYTGDKLPTWKPEEEWLSLNPS